MPEYRIYTIGGDGRAWSAEDIEYRDDQEAIQKARWIVHGRDVELWKQGRFIARLPGTPRTASACEHLLNSHRDARLSATVPLVDIQKR